MKQNISSFDFYTKIAPSNSRLKSRVCDGKIIKVAVNENKTFVAKDNLYYQQAVSLHASDWFVTRAKLLKAQKDGASAERLVKILDDGIFSHARQP